MTDPAAPSTRAGRAMAAKAKSQAWSSWEAIAQFDIPDIEAEARATATVVDITGIDAIERAVTADLLAQIEKAVLAAYPKSNVRGVRYQGWLEGRASALAAIRSAAPVEPTEEATE